MQYEIVLAPGAVKDLRDLRAYDRTQGGDAIEKFLRHEPTRVSRTRIKRLRGLRQPQFRLRVGETRVFYDVTETEVRVLAVVSKQQAQEWLDEQSTPEA